MDKFGRTPAIAFGYIGGTSNSGSTLMSFLLNAQTEVASIGEVAWSIPKRNPGQYKCSCGATLDTCHFWIEVYREMEQRGFRFNADHWNTSFEIYRNRLLRAAVIPTLGSGLADRLRDNLIQDIPGWGRRLSEIGRRNAALIESIATVKGASAFVDASKDPARVRLLRKYCAVEPYVIHLVRDSPAFVNSFIKNRRSSRWFHTAIRWWNLRAWQMEYLRRTTADERWLLVRYEDLCSNPAAEMKRVLNFLGVKGLPVLEFRRAPQHVIGNKMRLLDSSEIRLDTSFRSELTRAELGYIMKKTSKYRQALGYEGNEQ